MIQASLVVVAGAFHMKEQSPVKAKLPTVGAVVDKALYVACYAAFAVLWVNHHFERLKLRPGSE
jgi:hypothetical protein